MAHPSLCKSNRGSCTHKRGRRITSRLALCCSHPPPTPCTLYTSYQPFTSPSPRPSSPSEPHSISLTSTRPHLLQQVPPKAQFHHIPGATQHAAAHPIPLPSSPFLPLPALSLPPRLPPRRPLLPRSTGAHVTDGEQLHLVVAQVDAGNAWEQDLFPVCGMRCCAGYWGAGERKGGGRGVWERKRRRGREAKSGGVSKAAVMQGGAHQSPSPSIYQAHSNRILAVAKTNTMAQSLALLLASR